jgi:hypothetical protein
MMIGMLMPIAVMHGKKTSAGMTAGSIGVTKDKIDRIVKVVP